MRRIQDFLKHKASTYVVVFVFIQTAANSSSSAQGVSIYQAKEDLQRLKQTIEYHNPRVSINNPNFANDADAIIETLSDSLSWNSFYSMVYQICALSKDSKYIIGNKSLPFQRSLHRGRVPLFPINIRILDGKMFVWNDRSQEGHFDRGDEILLINGRSAEEIIELIYTVTPKDIDAPGLVEHNLWTDFNWKYFLFVDTATVFNITARNNSNQSIEHEISGLAVQAEMPAIWYEREQQEASDATKKFLSEYFLTYDNGTAVMHMPELSLLMYLRGQEVNFNTYKYIFKEISERLVDNLVIDLRSSDAYRMSFANDMVPFILKQNNNDSYLLMNYSNKGYKGKTLIPKSAKHAFKGRLFVLVDATTNAEGCTLARYLVEYGNAISIGEETTFRYEGWSDINDRDVVVLIKSRVKVYIPRTYYQFPISKKQQTTDVGLIPQYPISYTLEDLMEGTDLEMEKAMEIIKQNSAH